jgi:menaquinone-9 beta-reductase
MEHCDVLIVGGGPAGSACAWRLRRAGLDVVVMDKQTFPRDKVCAGWITPAVLAELDIDAAHYAANRVFQPITRFRTGVIGGAHVDTVYDRTVSYGIRRCEFDHYLLERSGARLRLGEPLRRLTREGDTWLVNDALRTPLVIGAGGHFCPVARHLGSELGRGEPAVAAQEIEHRMDAHQLAACRVQPEAPELYFCSDLKGYGWCFRKGDYLNVGLGRQDHHRLAEHVERFAAWLKQQRRIPADVPSRFHGHAYLLYHDAPRSLLGEGVLLIGDAAGLAYPQSGEGIRPAIESALLAADTVLAARGDYRALRLHAYAEALARRFGPRGADQPLLVRMAPPRLVRSLAGTLLGTRWFSRRVLLDRWFLHAHQAPLQI